MQVLNGAFEVDFPGYAVMSNHWHAVIRTRPNLAEKLSGEEVVERWMRVFPKRREGTLEQTKKATENEVRQILKSKKRVDELRSRLSSVSWFMKSMNEALDIDAGTWVQNIENYGKLFYRVAGKVDSLIQAAKECGVSWFKGHRGSKALFRTPEPATATSN